MGGAIDIHSMQVGNLEKLNNIFLLDTSEVSEPVAHLFSLV